MAFSYCKACADFTCVKKLFWRVERYFIKKKIPFTYSSLKRMLMFNDWQHQLIEREHLNSKHHGIIKLLGQGLMNLHRTLSTSISYYFLEGNLVEKLQKPYIKFSSFLLPHDLRILLLSLAPYLMYLSGPGVWCPFTAALFCCRSLLLLFFAGICSR